MSTNMNDSKDIASLFRGLSADGYADLRQQFAHVHTFQPPPLSANSVRQRASELVKTICDGHKLLGEVLGRQEATIHRRWQKKTRDQRRTLILRAWGTEMALCHRPDMDMLKKFQSYSEQNNMIPVRDALTWPYINQEDLLKPRSLLLFLAARGRHHPADFAAADLEAMRLGITINYLNPGQLPHYAMMFTGRKEAGKYGELVHIGTHVNSDQEPHVSHGKSVADGLLILNAQAGVMKFLVNCTGLILQDIPMDAWFDGPVLPAPALSAETDAGFASLAIMSAEAPYRLPAQLDFTRDISLLAAKRDQAADHLLALREDPGYFLRYLLEINEHRPEMYLSKTGRPNSDLEPQHAVEYWTRVLWDVVIADYMQLEMYTELHIQAEALQHMYKSYAGVIRPECDLPGPYMQALLRLRYYLKEALMVVAANRLPVFPSPPWREHFRCTIVDRDSTAHIIHLKEPCEFNTVQQNLYVILNRLVPFKDRGSANHGPKELSMFWINMMGMTTVMDELHRLVESEPDAKAMFTPYITSSIGDLAIMSECLHQLEIYQPWASTFDAMLTDDLKKSLREEYHERTITTERRIWMSLDTCGQSLGRLGAPLNGRFLYPIEKRRTEDVVTALRKAEKDLDAFWHTVNKPIIKAFGPLKKTAIQRFFAQSRSAQRTPVWVEPSKNKILSGPQDLYIPFSELEVNSRHETEQTTSKNEKTAETKSKAKTRGTAVQVEPRNVQDQTDEEKLNHPPSFTVNARALKVFKTLFFTPSITATPGEVQWSDFLHAMVSVGFAPEKLYGSIWHFRPTKAGLERSINFHEPHKGGKSTGKLPYCVARGIGRRLNRAYGWGESSFSLAEK